jgi:hypothetical protein
MGPKRDAKREAEAAEQPLVEADEATSKDE